MNQNLLFKFGLGEGDSTPIRVIVKNGEPYFCLADVCANLDLDSSQVSKRLEDEVVTIHPIKDRLGRTQRAKFVNEDGLYDTILESRKPSAKAFRKWITKEVLPSIRRTGGYGHQEIPDFIKRVILNAGQVPPTHFSIINELFATVYGAFEQAGHRLSDKAVNGVRLRPDVSVGRCFSAWLQKNGYDPADGRITYKHKFPEGYEVEVYAYPNKMLGIFRDYVYQEWLPNQAPKYLRGKDNDALAILPKLLPPSTAA